MALETWLIKVKRSISHTLDSVRAAPPPAAAAIRKSNVGVLAFEIAAVMSKLLHLWQSLSDKNLARLRGDSICLEGVRKIVSNDDAFLLGLACAELAGNLRLIAKSIARISNKCEDASLRSFDRLFEEFADTGRDRHNWLILSPKEIDAKMKKLDQFVASAAALHREMDELVSLENSLKKSLQSREISKEHKNVELRQRITWQRQQVKYMKEKSLWCRSFDTATSILARTAFAVLARMKLVFGVASLPRRLHCPRPPLLPRESPRQGERIALLHWIRSSERGRL